MGELDDIAGLLLPRDVLIREELRDLQSAVDARAQRIAELEQREQQAWLAAWDAEWRAQRDSGWVKRCGQEYAVLCRKLDDTSAERIAAQDALLERAEAALAHWCDDDLVWCDEQQDEMAATLAALRERREVRS